MNTRAVGMITMLWAAVFLPACVLAGGAGEGDQCSIHVVRAVTNRRILPQAQPTWAGELESLQVVVAPGEFEPASFVVRAQTKIQDLQVLVSPLKGPEGLLDPAVVDVRTVKVWYQNQARHYREEIVAEGYSPVERGHTRTLVPELLLKDDSLVKVDYDKQANFLRIKGSYLDISQVCGPHDPKTGLPIKTREEFLFTDAKTLQPVAIPAGANKQFWLTVRVAGDTPAGLYKGAIRLKSARGAAGEVAISIRVLPFKLPRPYYISSIYYNPLNHVYYNTRELMLRQFEKEMQNLYDHGFYDVSYPYRLSHTEAFLVEALKIRRRIGINNKQFYYMGNLGMHSMLNVKDLEPWKKRVEAYIQTCRANGVEDVFIYGFDEAKREMLTKQRKLWDIVHQAGGKIFVAGYHHHGQFDYVGDIQDLLINAGYPSREAAEKWHSVGHKIVCYANPQGGVEQPDNYRRNYGILIWQYDFDGHMTYIYHWGNNRQGKGALCIPYTWNEFSHMTNIRWREHNMVYPTADGVIDTVQWEGHREGIDDVRYLTLLLNEMKRLGSANDAKAAEALKAVKAFLKELKAGDVNKDVKDMDALRARIVEHILALRKVGS